MLPIVTQKVRILGELSNSYSFFSLWDGLTRFHSPKVAVLSCIRRYHVVRYLVDTLHLLIWYRPIDSRRSRYNTVLVLVVIVTPDIRSFILARTCPSSSNNKRNLVRAFIENQECVSKDDT